MSDLEMPRFNETLTITQEEWDEASKPAGARFNPGQYDVVVDAAEWKKSETDDNWVLVTCTLKGTGQKTIKDFVLVPTAAITKYRGRSGKETAYPLRKFKDFCAGLGIEVTQNNVLDTVKRHFFPVKKLLGKPLKVTIGYTKGHVCYANKQGEEVAFKIIMKDGNDLVDPVTKLPVLFPDRAAAALYAKDNKIEIGFESVTDYEKAPVSAAVGNW